MVQHPLKRSIICPRRRRTGKSCVTEVTLAENALWRSLKKSAAGAKFRRQHGVGPYVLDFCCPEHKLAIEIQGGVHDDALRREYDAERRAYLESQGIRVYFENRALLERSKYVMEVIRSVVAGPPPRLRR